MKPLILLSLLICAGCQEKPLTMNEYRNPISAFGNSYAYYAVTITCEKKVTRQEYDALLKRVKTLEAKP